MNKKQLLLGVIGFCAAGVGQAAAQKVDDFYRGKTITIIVGFTPGGSYDAYARMLSRHMSRHVPGEPGIIVQNMPGAGTLTAVRYLDTTAPKDGTVMATFTAGLISASQFEPETIKFKFSDLGWVGSITRDFSVCYAYYTTQIYSLADAKKKPEFIIGDSAKGSSASINSSILSQLLGVKVRTILGYTGSAESRMAIERGELEGHCGAWVSIPTDWRAGGKITPFVRFSRARLPDLPESAAFAGDLVTSEEDKRVIDFLLAPSEVGRPYVVSRQVPATRLQVLRAGFSDAMKDAAFLAEADRLGLPVSPIDGRESAALVEGLYDAPAEVVAKGKAVMK